jgi:tRNA threonylcarbamoyladenosine biosynthesis protein TsaE
MKRSFHIDEIQNVAEEVVKIISEHKADFATVVALSGDLGAGKTTLTQTIARNLGVKENLISPTFVIMKRYELEPQGFQKSSRRSGSNRPIFKIPAALEFLVHIDAYRLNSEKELETLGWQELISNPKNLILIEWPERVPKLIPKDAIRITLEHKDDSNRHIEIVL